MITRRIVTLIARATVPSLTVAVLACTAAPSFAQPGVRFLRREADCAVYRIESGACVFESRW